ncbi:MAG TPA: P1 family peptidase [Methylomirabilota bacterium]|nr:P1 family peptidase [Methylomirabilota bacterium]
MEGLTLRDVPGLQVGHDTDAEGITGCTVVLATGGAVAGVDVRGAAPGTRETDLLRPGSLVQRIHAITLAGGSAFGLAAADGVMGWLAQRGIGFPTEAGPVPIVPAAILYDLSIGSDDARPTARDGEAACDAAERGHQPLEGSVGAGTGATVAKLHGADHARMGGVGMAGRRLPGGRMLAAMAVCNALGSVVARDGRVLAGPAHAVEPTDPPRHLQHTTLAVIGTDADLDHAQCTRLAQIGHDALARSISPVHTMFDGDTVFALSTGGGAIMPAGEFMGLGVLAVELLSEAIERSVLTATSRGGVPAVGA